LPSSLGTFCRIRTITALRDIISQLKALLFVASA